MNTCVVCGSPIAEDRQLCAACLAETKKEDSDINKKIEEWVRERRGW